MAFFIRALQYIWLVLALIAIAMGAFAIKNGTTDKGLYFLLIVLVCGIMFTVNRARYKRFMAEKEQKQDNGGAK